MYLVSKKTFNMKYIFTIFAAFVLCTSAIAQQVGSKVSLVATDGKTYTGVITEVQGEKYKIKYDGFDFEAWLASNQFTVTENPPANNQHPPALPETIPQQPALPQTPPETQPQTQPETQPEMQPQTMPETAPQTMPGSGPDNTGMKTMTRGDSLKMTINNIKNAFGAFNNILKAKRDTITIMISDIDYDNANLSQLRENLKKVKGVKSVTMHYKSSTAIMEISGKGKATDVWDNLPAFTRSAFKLLEAGDYNLILKQKTP